jgi:hypothetical protein
MPRCLKESDSNGGGDNRFKEALPVIRKLLLVVPVIALFALATAPKASADSFTLNYDFCTDSCLGGSSSGGTVTVSQVDFNTVQFDVELSDPLHFHQTSGLDAFMFNDSGSQTLTFDFTTANFSTAGTNLHEDGAGTFDYVVKYNFQPAVDGQSLIFTVSATNALSLTEFETTDGGDSVVDFAANVSNGVCTGLIGAGNGTGQSTPTVLSPNGSCTTPPPPPPVPEPASLTLLGSGLAFLGTRLRRKKA